MNLLVGIKIFKVDVIFSKTNVFKINTLNEHIDFDNFVFLLIYRIRGWVGETRHNKIKKHSHNTKILRWKF